MTGDTRPVVLITGATGNLGGSLARATATALAGAALVALSFRAGPIREHYGRWDGVIRRQRGS